MRAAGNDLMGTWVDMGMALPPMCRSRAGGNPVSLQRKSLDPRLREDDAFATSPRRRPGPNSFGLNLDPGGLRRDDNPR